MSNCRKKKRLINNLPLSYVIRKDTTPLTVDHSELIIYNASLTTDVFKDDRRKVEDIITPLVLDTDSFEWGDRKVTQSKGRK